MNTTKFINDNFLLRNKYAEELYHNHASKMPIIDYHCHLSPKDIAENRVFENITKAWLDGDHYKWRAMRTLGINEKYITGNASDEEKFQQWAKTVPYTLRNPLFHWTQLELARYFDVYELLNEKNAKEIYKITSDKLNSSDYSCQQLLSKMNVKVVCTTEDPIDTLEHHQQLAKSNFDTHISTSFRPDKAIMIGNDGFIEYLGKLEKAADISITSYQDLLDALVKRVQYFNENGCKVSDHGLNSIPFAPYSEAEVDQILKKRLKNEQLSFLEIEKFESAVLQFLAEQYHSLGWIQQFHLGALRNNNTRMLAKLGPDTGWDSISDYPQAEKLSKFLNSLDGKDKLSKTIIYNLNPADNEVMATMIGNFNDGSVKGKVQFGSGWWFLDQKDGMTKQMNALSNMGLISCFIGMLTDSRSFLSYPRHEYFRRILCNLLGEEIENGELPNDMEWIGKIVEDISYNNAQEYFDF
ncbi:glucuronate isomerase [Galbibacter orientalis DSM 19592]|mgnify:CR=1 FL=1|uniref:Uronate isomerase n=1 Tax=Galbibacter orientalis DSM 19592 TaxID=926559 RepID=I3C159_9FLAO|nr:glucuronate isomerase [Galbibacter orientalis]EIJ37352.1 glucuronate isomerase [Galbibacter orientalis DSM 19592]